MPKTCQDNFPISNATLSLQLIRRLDFLRQ